jgi:hypothetical protein
MTNAVSAKRCCRLRSAIFASSKAELDAVERAEPELALPPADDALLDAAGESVTSLVAFKMCAGVSFGAVDAVKWARQSA